MELMDGVHSSKDEYRMALYKTGAKLNKDTKAYDPMGECSGQGYTPGGVVLKDMQLTPTQHGVAVKFADVVMENCSIQAQGCLVYNASKENRAVAVFAFPNATKSINGKFSVSYPTHWFSIG
jgi:hypothetical protein